MEIHEHAIDRYIERVLGLKVEDVGDTVREWIRSRLEEVVENPTVIYNGKDGEPPIHIDEEVAIPVDPEGDGKGYTVVPSAYSSETFRKKI